MVKRRGSRMTSAVTNAQPHMSATYQKNLGSWPACLNHKAMYSADPPKTAADTL